MIRPIYPVSNIAIQTEIYLANTAFTKLINLPRPSPHYFSVTELYPSRSQVGSCQSEFYNIWVRVLQWSGYQHTEVGGEEAPVRDDRGPVQSAAVR